MCNLTTPPGTLRSVSPYPAYPALSTALPYVQVYMAQTAARAHSAGDASSREAHVPESPLFGGTPVLSQRRGIAPAATPFSAARDTAGALARTRTHSLHTLL